MKRFYIVQMIPYDQAEQRPNKNVIKINKCYCCTWT